ncbi:MAG: ion transporter, partial [Eubacterium sp.]|nr:ion transporter [Eubacterium sp.]
SILPSLSIINKGFKTLRVLRMVRAFKVFKVFKAIRYSKSFKIIGHVISPAGQMVSVLSFHTLPISHQKTSSLSSYPSEPCFISLA